MSRICSISHVGAAFTTAMENDFSLTRLLFFSVLLTDLHPLRKMLHLQLRIRRQPFVNNVKRRHRERLRDHAGYSAGWIPSCLGRDRSVQRFLTFECVHISLLSKSLHLFVLSWKSQVRSTPEKKRTPAFSKVFTFPLPLNVCRIYTTQQWCTALFHSLLCWYVSPCHRLTDLIKWINW